ncbi:MAG: hypothetical protein V9G19_04775 [Tetrasphaera sp.]
MGDVTAGAGANRTGASPAPDGLIWAWALPLLVRAVTCGASAIVVMVWARTSGASQTRDWLQLWDARWYAQIAESGYPAGILIAPNRDLLVGTEFAFFPLFPAGAGLLARISGLTPAWACLLLALAASLLLGPVTFRAARGEGAGRAGALLAVALLGALPMSVIFIAGYAEALFLLLAFLALVAAQQRQWAPVAVFLLLASLTRPAGLVTAAGVGAYGLIHWRRRRGAPGEAAAIGAAALVGALGIPAVWQFVEWRSGVERGWFVVQEAGWGTTFDRGRSTWTFVKRLVVVRDLPPVLAATVAALLLLVLLLTVALVASSAGRPFVPWLLLGWISVIGASNFWYSRPRLLLVDAVLVIPVAVVLAGRARSRLVVIGGGALVVASLLFGAYLTLTWPYAI